MLIEGALARAIFAYNGVNFARLHSQAYPIQRLHTGEALANLL